MGIQIAAPRQVGGRSDTGESRYLSGLTGCDPEGSHYDTWYDRNNNVVRSFSLVHQHDLKRSHYNSLLPRWERVG